MRLVLSIILLCFITTTIHAQHKEKKARKYMKKFGLEQNELYTVSKNDYAKRYADEKGFLSFPSIYFYNSSGKEQRIQWKMNNHVWKPFTCHETLLADFAKITATNDSFSVVTIDSLNNSWALAHVKPIYTAQDNKGMYRMYIYFPVGMGILYKRVYPYYERLVEEVKKYQESSPSIQIHFVLVPVLK